MWYKTKILEKSSDEDMILKDALGQVERKRYEKDGMNPQRG